MPAAAHFGRPRRNFAGLRQEPRLVQRPHRVLFGAGAAGEDQRGAPAGERHLRHELPGAAESARADQRAASERNTRHVVVGVEGRGQVSGQPFCSPPGEEAVGGEGRHQQRHGRAPQKDAGQPAVQAGR